MNQVRLKMTGSKKTIVLLFGLIACLHSNAQQWDFRTWHKVQAYGELVKDLELSVEQQLRLQDNSLRVDKTLTEVGLTYDMPKGFDAGFAYRLSWSPDKDGVYGSEHRYNIDLGYGIDFWKMKAKVRARYQHSPSPSLFSERRQPQESPMVVRVKAGVEYRELKKIRPGVEFELFVRTDLPSENGLYRFRYKAFIDLDLPKRQSMGFFYMLQTDYSGRYPEFASVVGISFAYEWKRPKKGKDKK